LRLPLAGRTIVVTRPQDRADEMIAAVVQLGGEALVCPMIEAKPLPGAEAHREVLDKLDRFDWLIFTSAAAVEAFHLWLQQLGINELPHALRIIVVGDKTAAAVQEQGWRVDAIAEYASAEGVVTTLVQQGVELNTTILFPRALKGRDTIPQEMEKIGARIVVLPVYQTVPVIPNNLEDLRARLRQRKIDAITFTSPSAVQQFFRLLPLNEWPILREICLAAIGRTTATAIREHGLRASVMPQTTSAVALIETIAEYFQKAKTFTNRASFSNGLKNPGLRHWRRWRHGRPNWSNPLGFSIRWRLFPYDFVLFFYLLGCFLRTRSIRWPLLIRWAKNFLMQAFYTE
jgi:uroporphyrinogen-III synthase